MNVSPTFPAPTTTVHLQYVGTHHAVRADELTVGCVIVWNGGELSLVTKIERTSKCFLAVTSERLSYSAEHGYQIVKSSLYGDKYSTRRMKLDRAVAYSPRATVEVVKQGTLTTVVG
jgi:hypothetical protein